MTHRKSRTIIVTALAAVFIAYAASPASGQLSREQLDKVRQQRLAERANEGVTYTGRGERRSPTRHLHTTIIDPVTLDNVRARDAFRWWSRATGIPLVINWRAMEEHGIDPDTPIDLDLRNVPAGVVLSLMMKQLSPQEPLMYEVAEYYIRIMTKEEANKDTVVLVYDVRDLTQRIPNFVGPEFDLNDALSNTSSGGSSTAAQSATTLFGDDNDPEQEKSEEERGEEIVELIRTTIEPSIWQAYGGLHASIRYFNGRLIVKAPRYVHAQIGIPAFGGQRSDGRTYRVIVPAKSGTDDVAGIRLDVDEVAGIRK